MDGYGNTGFIFCLFCMHVHSKQYSQFHLLDVSAMLHQLIQLCNPMKVAVTTQTPAGVASVKENHSKLLKYSFHSLYSV